MHSQLSKISVITVCRNAAGTIGANIFSVYSQKYDNVEHIIIDGASTDGTVELLRGIQEQGNVRFISEADNGIYDAMNKGIKLADGEWVFFLGSDDIFFDDEVLTRIFCHNLDK